MAKVDFNTEMFSVLSERDQSPSEDISYQFPLWDILKELDRRSRRAGRDSGKSIRDYMCTHSAEVERIKEKHGL